MLKKIDQKILRIFVMNMKKYFQKIAATVLTCLVLLSTFSFTVEKHYCGRFLVDVAVFSKAKDCGMDMRTHSNDHKVVMNKKSCCKDEILVLEGQDELKISLDQVDIHQQVFAIFFLDSYKQRFSVLEKERLSSVKYVPPERVPDILILYETFLI